ncbi:hypothetical protein XaC1_294 [Xanthomonas phage XaC1]|nr:hypothetical protein XaC1_294 [Xanthomonas phage XaC1]
MNLDSQSYQEGFVDGYNEGFDKGFNSGYDTGHDNARNEITEYYDSEILELNYKHGYELQEVREEVERNITDKFHSKIDEYLRVIELLKTELKNTTENYYTLRKEHEAIQRLITKNSE